MPRNPNAAQKAHIAKKQLLAERARKLIFAAYEALASAATLDEIGAAFDAVEAAASETIGLVGKDAIEEGSRFAEDLLGFEVQPPTLEDLADIIEVVQAEIAEEGRHHRRIISLRSERMQRAGMAPRVIAAQLQADFAQAGRSFGAYRNAVTRLVVEAVNRLARAAYLAAFRGRQRADAQRAS